MDEFGDAVTLSSPKGLVETAWTTIGGGTTVASATTLFIAIFAIASITRILSSRSEPVQKGSVNEIPVLPYSFPFFRHAFSLLFRPSFLSSARDASHYGIFGVKAGPYSANFVSDPALVTAVIQKREADVQFFPIGWKFMRNLFGVRGGKKLAAQWEAAWAPLHGAIVSNMMREPQLGRMVDRVIEKMERAIPSMITFTENPIDQQPWEKAADISIYDPETPEVYLDLLELMRNLLGEVSIPAMMGDRFMEKYPNTINDLITMDDGFSYMVLGVSRFFPLPKVFRAYHSRKKLMDSLADFDTALEMTLDGKNPASDSPDWEWGDMDDVSEMIVQRAKIYKEHGFEIKDRNDLSLLWAFTVNSTVLVYWHILYILATPDLLPKILAEIAPHATVTPPLTINGFSTRPNLKLSAEGLSKSCPLFKSTYFETQRLVNQATSVRRVGNDITISPHNPSPSPTEAKSPPTSFKLHKSSYIIMPNSLHNSDPTYFPNPTTFIPDRFIIPDETSSSKEGKPEVKVTPLTTRPYGGGTTACKGRLLAEKECLALVAGVLMMWEIEPADPRKGWVIPGLKRKSAVAEPKFDTRVKVRRRQI